MCDALKSSLHCNENHTTSNSVQTWVTAPCDIGTSLMQDERKAA